MSDHEEYDRIEQAMDVVQSHAYRITVRRLKPELRAAYADAMLRHNPEDAPPESIFDITVIRERATYEQVKEAVNVVAGFWWDNEDLFGLADNERNVYVIKDEFPYATLIIERVQTTGCGEDFVGWDVITMIASYWHHRAWENHDRYDLACMKRAMFLDSLAVKAKDEERAAIQNDDYLRMYYKWKEEGQDDAAIFALLKGCGTFV